VDVVMRSPAVLGVPTGTSSLDDLNGSPGPSTVGWKIQREIVVLLAWGPAILLQLAHPLVARAVADHSTFSRAPHGRVRRFRRTLTAMLSLAFGTEGEARGALARINAIHDGVHGLLPERVGPFRAGTPYSAHDPALLAWVHATLLDMNVRVYELFVQPLSSDEKDRYCVEASAIEKPLGIPEGRLPRTFADLTRYMERTLTSGEIVVSDVARSLAREIVHPPAPRAAAPGISFMRLVISGLLPAMIREQYGFRWDAQREVVLSVSARLARTIVRMMPPILRQWPAARGGRPTDRERSSSALGGPMDGPPPCRRKR
jgi:uncharacterized protein (DUF2236 family)